MLTLKPDFEDARIRWNHFWNGEVYDRPLLLWESHDGPWAPNPYAYRYRRACEGRWDEILDDLDVWTEHHTWHGESMPSFDPDWGPDQYAAFCGARLRFTDSSPDTNWVDPIVDDWESFGPVSLDEGSAAFQGVLAYAAALAERGAGRWLTAPIDAHSHADTLSALRGPQRFAQDLIDCPEAVDRAMGEARRLFPQVYEAVYAAGRMGGPRGCAQGPVWSEGRFGIIQCDFIYMIGPRHFRRFILPAIEEEVAHLDHCYFHLDGPNSFRHVNDLLSIPNLGIISVDSGDGHPVNHTWVDLFKRILAKGKMVKVYGAGLDLDRIKVLHEELGPRGVIYCPAVGTVAEFDEIRSWLTANT